MRITQATHDRLVIEDRPWFFAVMVWMIGLAALWAGLTGDIEGNGMPLWAGQLVVGAIGAGCCLFAWWAFPFQDIEFDRRHRRITRKIRRLYASRIEQEDMAGFEMARAGGSWDDGDRLERLELVLANRTWPLEWGYTSAPRARIAAQINRWYRGEDIASGGAGSGEVETDKSKPTAADAVAPRHSGIPDTRRDLE